MAYDYSALCGRIVEICKTQGAFATKMNLSERSISLKLNNARAWKQPEIIKACEVLGIPDSEIARYFFKKVV